MGVVMVGATGNVGSALVRRLATETGRRSSGSLDGSPKRPAPFDRVEWHPIGVGDPRSESRLVAVVEGADAVVHLACAIPLMSTTRARVEPGWRPAVPAPDAVREALGGVARHERLRSSPQLR